MLETLLALLEYLKRGKDVWYPFIETIKKYSGEIAKAKETVKFNDPLPAVFILGINGKSTAENPSWNFDLLIVTESVIFDKNKNQYDNLIVEKRICDYIRNNACWYYNGVPYSIDTENIESKTLMSTDRFFIMTVSLKIDHSYTSTDLVFTGDSPTLPNVTR